MIQSFLVRLVGASARFRWTVAIAYTVLAGVAGVHAALQFRISTDTERLMPASLEWRRHQAAFERLFPPDRVLLVIDGRSPEAADRAAGALLDALEARAGRPGVPIRRVDARGWGPFYTREALMLAPPAQAYGLARRLGPARPLLAVVAADPTLGGFARASGAAADGAIAGRLPPSTVGTLFADAASAIDDPDHRPFSPERALGAAATGPGATRRVIAVDPVLDYRALRPGAAASAAVRAAWRSLAPDRTRAARLAITGEVPVNDEQFAAVQQGQTVGLLLTTAAVCVIFFLALRSVRIMAAVAFSLGCGFAITCSVAILLVGSFNLLSVAFAILFVGLGADFGIQFSVRYREERFRAGLRHLEERAASTSRPLLLRLVLAAAGRRAGTPLALAAVSTAVGFLSFLPTPYRGVSELGLIAGVGMVIAFFTTVTLLPATLAILQPPGEAQPMGFRFLAPVDRVLGRHRVAVIAGTFGLVLVLSPTLFFVRFDFDPTHMQIPTGEAVSAFNRLRADDASGVEALDVAAPDLAAADALAHRLAALPEVAAVRTVSALVTTDPAAHVAAIDALRTAIGPALARAAGPAGGAASDRALVATLRTAAGALRRAASLGAERAPAGAAALAATFARLAEDGPDARRAADAAIAPPLAADLDRLRLMADGTPSTIATLPEAVRRSWIAPGGQARVEALPRGDALANAVLARFARAVARVAPAATGAPASLLGWRRTVVRAFVEAGGYAIGAIAIVLLLVLRRPRDVGLTLVPLLVAGVVTLELATLFGMTLNFANIIALPLLLGVGVAFKIYYVMAWREGVTELLQSTLTRAVLFSAMTTATAFGSLWLSPQPGTSSMGAMMALALGCTLCAAVLFQPALMGRPPNKKERGPAPDPTPT